MKSLIILSIVDRKLSESKGAIQLKLPSSDALKSAFEVRKKLMMFIFLCIIIID